MKKNTARWWIVLAVLLVVYHVVIFAVPIEKTPVFFLSWAFTLVAMGLQVYVIYTAFYKGMGVRSKFYGFPIAKLGIVYLLVQLVLGLAFMLAGQALALWIPLVVYAVLLAATVIGFVAADAARDEAERQDTKVQKNTARMRDLQAKAASLVDLAQDDSLKQELAKLAEAFRFSDPVSGEALVEIESELTDCLHELQRAIVDGDIQSAISLCQRASIALAERNRLCKQSK